MAYSNNKLPYMSLMVLASAMLLSACSTISNYTRLTPSESVADVRQHNPYAPDGPGRSFYSDTTRDPIAETNAVLRQRFPASKGRVVEIAVIPQQNMVDGPDAFSPVMGTGGTMEMSNKLVTMTEGTGIFVASHLAGFCNPGASSTPRFLLETQVTNYDQYVSNRSVGPAATVEDGGYTGDLSKGSEVSRDSFYLLGRLKPCAPNEPQTVDNLKVEVQSTRSDDSILVFAKVLGFVIRKTKSKSPGLTNATFIANDALLSNLILKHIDNYSRLANGISYAPRASSYVSPSNPKTQYMPQVDEVVSYGEKTYRDQKYYFPREAARDFKCSFGYQNKCSMVFDMPRNGRLSDMEYYMRMATNNAGGKNTKVGCKPKGRSRVICKINGNMTNLKAFAFRKELFGR